MPNLLKLNEKPFHHIARNGIEFTADRCDFRTGVTVKIPDGTSKLDLVAGVAEIIAFHALNIQEHLDGFTGYDAIEFRRDGCERAKRLCNTVTSCGNDLTPESGNWLRNHFSSCNDCSDRYRNCLY